jgi:hypothetical protein
MKKFIYHVLFFAGAASMLLTSCKKDYAKVYFDGGSAPVLTATTTDSIPLPLSDTTGNAVTFNWTNPNYQYSDGISSMNVAYSLQFDTVSSFSSNDMQQVVISSNLSQTFTVSSLNTLLSNQMSLATGVSNTIYVRLESFLSAYTSGSANIGATYSNALTYTVTPYAPPPAIAPPPTGTLFITGAATPEGWLNGTTDQQFTPVAGSNGLIFTITIQLTGDQDYKFIGNNNGYTYQYTVATNEDPTEVNGGPFISGTSNNIIAPAATAIYVIVVNFQTGKFTVTAQ